MPIIYGLIIRGEAPGFHWYKGFRLGDGASKKGVLYSGTQHLIDTINLVSQSPLGNLTQHRGLLTAEFEKKHWIRDQRWPFLSANSREGPRGIND